MQAVKQAWSGHAPSLRVIKGTYAYHGDPGPASARFWASVGPSRPSPTRALSTDTRAARKIPNRVPLSAQPSFRVPRGGSKQFQEAVKGTRGIDQQKRPQTRLPLKERPKGYTGALTKKNEPGLRYDDAASFVLSNQIKEYLKHNPSPMKSGQIEKLVTLVKNAPPLAQNAVVWNQVLHVLGREEKHALMWRTFQDMKKRNIAPTSRTFTTLINAYASVAHDGRFAPFTPESPPTPKTLQRVVDIYNDSQAYISDHIAQARGETDDSGGLRPAGKQESASNDSQEVNVAATNAYLKFLGRYGLWTQINKIRLAMDTDGMLAPDNMTFTTMFSSFLNKYAQQVDAGKAETARKEEIGTSVRRELDAAVRQFHPIDYHKKPDPSRRVDEEFALLTIQGLMNGRPEDVDLGNALMAFIWDIRLPRQGGPASTMTSPKTRPETDVPRHMRQIPEIPITVRAATSILGMLTRTKQGDIAAKCAKHFLSDSNLSSIVDHAFLRTAIHALSAGGDVSSIIKLLNSYQAPSGNEPWPYYVWDDALLACRRANSFDDAVDLCRRMSHLPLGIENGVPPHQAEEYAWRRAGNIDKAGRKWFKPRPIMPTAKAVSALLQTALNSPPDVLDKNVRKAYNLLVAFSVPRLMLVPKGEMRGRGEIDLLQGPAESEVVNTSVTRTVSPHLILANDIRQLVQRLLQSDGQQQALAVLRSQMDQVLATWRPIMSPSNVGRKSTASQRSFAGGLAQAKASPSFRQRSDLARHFE